jgi:hypothetical protein
MLEPPFCRGDLEASLASMFRFYGYPLKWSEVGRLRAGKYREMRRAILCASCILSVAVFHHPVDKLLYQRTSRVDAHFSTSSIMSTSSGFSSTNTWVP